MNNSTKDSQLERALGRRTELYAELARRREQFAEAQKDITAAFDYTRWQRDVARASLESCWQERQELAEALGAVHRVSMQRLDRIIYCEREIERVNARSPSALDAGREARCDVEQQENAAPRPASRTEAELMALATLVHLEAVLELKDISVDEVPYSDAETALRAELRRRGVLP